MSISCIYLCDCHEKCCINNTVNHCHCSNNYSERQFIFLKGLIRTFKIFILFKTRGMFK